MNKKAQAIETWIKYALIILAALAILYIIWKFGLKAPSITPTSLRP